jgi:Xaa-Pro aminopeptidase
MKKHLVVISLGVLVFAGLLGRPLGGPTGPGVEETALLSQKERAALQNRWLKTRFETLLPSLMRREKIDLWVVICREHNEDPLYWTLVPQPSHFAWRLTMFIYALGADGVEALSVNRYGSGDLHKEFAAFYRPAWEPETVDPWEPLARIVRERNPKRVGINQSATFAFADGLSAENKDKLVRALGPGLASRLVSAERLAVGWLETRTAEELEFYPKIVALNHQVVTEAFSRKVLTPGTTTIDDLAWWVRERLAELNLETWFQPMFYVLRRQPSDPKDARTILPGDLVRCDIGVTYLGLNADIQESAYVLKPGETDAPPGLKDALAAGNRLQDILAAEFREGRTGNEILAAALRKAKAEGFVARIYSHPLGYHGHAAGTRVGLPDMQEGVPGMGDYPLFRDTVHAVELSVRVKIPEWGGQEIAFALEEDAAFTSSGLRFLDGRQTKLILIR